jgi:hypothetical protein
VRKLIYTDIGPNLSSLSVSLPPQRAGKTEYHPPGWGYVWVDLEVPPLQVARSLQVAEKSQSTSNPVERYSDRLGSRDETGIPPDFGQTSEPRLLDETGREKRRINRSSVCGVALVGPPHCLHMWITSSDRPSPLRCTVSLSLCSTRSIVQILDIALFVIHSRPDYSYHHPPHTRTHTHNV